MFKSLKMLNAVSLASAVYLMASFQDVGLLNEDSNTTGNGDETPPNFVADYEEAFKLLDGLDKRQTMSLLLNNGGEGRPIFVKFAGERLLLDSLFDVAAEDLETDSW